MREDIAKAVEKLKDLTRAHSEAQDRSKAAHETYLALIKDTNALYEQKLIAEHEVLRAVYAHP